MSLQAHLSELHAKHKALEAELAEAMAHPASSDEEIAELKRTAPYLDIEGMRRHYIAKVTDEFYDQYFAPRGVNSRWLSNTRERISGGHDVWRSGRDLVEEGSGVVDELR